ncbi:12124_t:CDS:2 [Ambispora gerdemannii]|uniref:12124_t:CDS:1 n=1 Tax=Ambispora gerdemannii TaxID=144530 RepID=A0A9N9FGN8_9GLOM|nr:12124_t:CDS:2 [Ambispora gerdemannii]
MAAPPDKLAYIRSAAWAIGAKLKQQNAITASPYHRSGYSRYISSVKLVMETEAVHNSTSNLEYQC